MFDTVFLTERVPIAASSIHHRLNALSKDTEYTPCIYRVPEKPRKANEATYTPKLGSIGPLHRERGQLQGMELYKLRCLRNFLNRSRVGLDRLVMFVANWETYLRNQIPIIVTEGLLDFVDHSFTFHDLAYKFFKDVGNTEKLPLTEYCGGARHFVEFLLILHSPAHRKEPPSFPAIKFEYTRSATELQQAGVKFRRAKGSCLFDVVFTKGELALPCLIVNDSTETFFQNLIVFEQCGYYSKDITICESKVVAELFNNLYREVVTETDNFYFAKLCEDLNAYSTDPFHEFKSKWFSNPWSLFSLFAAIVLLILTVIQTVCSILPVK
ncbi:hypothetical protein CDL12_04610 [Handroanthus impetiginosus]|uniref:Uncharacterized protein n=1 Tax=Handroanthus impetiginosus TaxID=429701 RepID=A0A2G9HYS0_9LAMI|nr:hypothetical protein CDL12_04610 [Handroanthus impetiginosus]